MNFCAKCGRERSGDARYCGGCGTEFAAAPAAAVTPPTDDTADGVLPPSATAEAQVPADATRIDRRPDVTMIDPPRGAAASARGATPAKAEPDPFAAWFAPDAPPAPRTEPAGQWQAAPEPWQAADTVYAGQRDPVYPPPSQQGPAYPPPRPPYGAQPTPPSGGGRSSGGRKAAFIVVVVLVMIAAGGGAYALVSRSSKGSTTQPPASPTAASPAASTAQSSASTSPSASTTPSASASASVPASASASVSASPTSSLVTVDPGLASNPAEPAVETTLSHYFHGINTRDYAEYQSAHNAQAQASESQSAFNSGYGSTTDSGMTLTSLESTANGGESASVTFTSRQAASASVDGSTCNDWNVTYYLVPQGTGYVIGPPPSGYQPSYTDC